MTDRNGGAPSLKWELVGILLACWILPVLIIVGVLGGYTSRNIQRQRTQTMTTAVENAVKIVNSRLESAIASSRNASYYGVIARAYRTYLFHKDPVALYDEVNSFLIRQYQYDDKFVATTIFFCIDPDNLCYTRASFDQQSHYSLVHKEVKALYPSIDTSVAFLVKEGKLFMVRNLMNGALHPYAVIINELRVNSVFESFQNLPWCTDALIRLNNTELVLRGEHPLPDSLNLQDVTVENQVLKEGAQFYVYGTQKQPDYRFSYSVGLDGNELMKEFTQFTRLLVLVLALAVPLLLVAVRFIYKNITRPIDKLITATRHIKGGDLGYQAESENSNGEFHYLTESFNRMSAKLKEQFEQIYDEEIALRDARIMALQSQINPHFLNNTLEIINWEARLENNIKVSRMIEALSTLLDAAMDRKGKPEVRLADEMIYVDAYLYIISERLGKRLTVEKDIDASLLDNMVPRLVMQPIIENAVEHGTQSRQRKIVIRARLEHPDSLVLEIENDGTLSREDQEHVTLLLSDHYDAGKEGSGNLGIRNVHQRLKILYGGDSGLRIFDDGQGHVIARIRVVYRPGTDGKPASQPQSPIQPPAI